MKKYKQLNFEERVIIRMGLFYGKSIREIKCAIIISRTYFEKLTDRLLRQKKLNNTRKRIIIKTINYIIQLHVHSVSTY